MSNQQYHPESYWSTVAKEIAAREGQNVVAGDDEPYYQYKREKFLRMLLALPIKGREILEIGPGPGGNLLALETQNPKRLCGCEISQTMIDIAGKRIAPATELVKTDGTSIPLGDKSFDIVFSATVLQHNSDDAMMRQMLAEMARVSRESVVLFEQVDSKISGNELRVARPIAYYTQIMEQNGYRLLDKEMIGIVASYYVSGAIRKIFNPSTRTEGQPPTALANFLQKATLPVTKVFDGMIGKELDLAKMHFVRKS